MNGADALIQTLVDGGVGVCFVNPGTSEMHLVQAIDGNPGMRVILGLFEGICSGAADGYGRMTGMPAATVFHLGPGLANATANLHNARRARSPVINLVGNHATWHIPYDPPLTSDIYSIANGAAAWVRQSKTADTVASDAADAIAACLTANPDNKGQVATMILPADCCWGDAPGAAKIVAPTPRPDVEEADVEEAAKRLREDAPSVLCISGQALSEAGVLAAHRIAAVTGSRVMSDMFPARLERGAGTLPIEGMQYFPEMALQQLDGVGNFIMAGVLAPVAFFAYQGQPSSLLPEGCEGYSLAGPEHDAVGALEALADTLDAPADVDAWTELQVPDKPTGDLTPETIGQAIAALLPEDAIVANEAATSGGPTSFLTRSAARHTLLNLTGGSIGGIPPLSAGAAVACPDRQVVALQGDGGGMYTVQALWTQAREKLDVTTVIFSNRRYNILAIEYMRAGVQNPGPKALSMFDLGNPDIGWSDIGRGMGVESVTVSTAEDFTRAFDHALGDPGPHLIEAVI